MKKLISCVIILMLLAALSTPVFAVDKNELQYTVSTDRAIIGHEYIFIMVDGSQQTLNLIDNGDNVLYIHQQTADGENLVFSGIMPLPFQSATAFIISDEGTLLRLVGFGDSSTRLVLPVAVKEIDVEAFADTNISYVVVPSGCTTIRANAFSGCEGLLTIELPASINQIEDNPFADSPNLTIIAPEESYAIHWSQNNGFVYASYTVEDSE